MNESEEEPEEFLEAEPEFKEFVTNIVRKRCLIKQTTFDKCFNTKESWSIMRQAFVHKSLDLANYDLLETEGDVIINLAIVEWIRATYPKIISTHWVNEIKHRLVSGKPLAKMAIKLGFDKYVMHSTYWDNIFAKYENKLDSDDYLDMHGDNMEAFCGAINTILNKCTTRGVGYVACYNLVASSLNETNFSVEPDKIFPPKSRLKMTYDMAGWTNIKGCSMEKNMTTYDLRSTTKNFQGKIPKEQAYHDYSSKYKNHSKYNKSELEIIEKATFRYATFIYACLSGSSAPKTLIAVATANTKKKAEKAASEIGIEYLKGWDSRLNYKAPDPYTRTKSKKGKKFVKTDI